MRILILEDDIALAKGIALTLREPEREFTICYTVEKARELLNQTAFDLLLLDINLPDGSGLALCQEIRERVKAPILFLTANDTELDMVTGLESGGDDYITKPFSLAVLRARVNVLLRRHGAGDGSHIVIDAFDFHFEAYRFSKAGQAVELSKTEQKLLYHLVANRGQTLSRERLLALIWPDGAQYVDENALSVAVRRLRAKLEADASNPQYIKTVYGVGYVWAVKP